MFKPTVLIGHPRVSHHVLEELGYELTVFGVAHQRVAYLVFDFLFLVGKILIFVPVATDVYLAFQLVEGVFDLCLKLVGPLVKRSVEQYANVASCRTEVAAVLHHQKCLEHPHRKWILPSYVVLGLAYCSIELRAKAVAQSLEH